MESVLNGNTGIVNEILICNDGSTDGTEQKLKTISSKHPIVRIVTHKTNLGGSAARNTAITQTKGEMIFCLDSDNLLLPGSLEYLYGNANESRADVVSFREIHFFKKKKNKISHIWRFPRGGFELKDYLAGTVVPGASGNYLFTKKAWSEVGGYRTNADALDSWAFGLDLVAHGKRMFVAESGYYLHRYGINSYWVRESKRKNISETAAMLLTPYLNQLDSKSRETISGHPEFWFNDIDLRPLRLKNSEAGRSGKVVIRSSRLRLRIIVSALARRIKKHFLTTSNR